MAPGLNDLPAPAEQRSNPGPKPHRLPSLRPHLCSEQPPGHRHGHPPRHCHSWTAPHSLQSLRAWTRPRLSTWPAAASRDCAAAWLSAPLPPSIERPTSSAPTPPPRTEARAPPPLSSLPAAGPPNLWLLRQSPPADVEARPSLLPKLRKGKQLGMLPPAQRVPALARREPRRLGGPHLSPWPPGPLCDAPRLLRPHAVLLLGLPRPPRAWTAPRPLT
mmetsp:Transcript_5238/g.12116  ORF Transcript_5238/g.12116 Transcript_5238/m.12116 type:complete len:218 (+) Transcript_5238:54-707(+)